MRDGTLVERMRVYGTTIFAEMNALAAATGAVNLGQGAPDTDGPQAMLDLAAAGLRDGGLNQYPPATGCAELTAAIASHRAKHYGLQYDPATEILVTVGATEAVSASILALCEPGDEVIVFEPYYDSYAAAVSLAGAKRVAVALRPDGPGGRFTFDPDELRAAVTRRTRAVLLNSPHNPTGTVLTHAELEVVAEVCREHDLVVISDEVYEHLAYDGTTHVTIASLPQMRERTVAISSAAKTFSVTGWKIGWVCAPAPLIRAINTVKQFLTFTHSAPLQIAVGYGLEHELAWVEAQRLSLAGRRDRLTAGLEAAGLTVSPAQGTYFVQADVRSLGHSDGETFARALPSEAGIVAIPTGVFCDTPGVGTPFVRFAFCKRDEVLDEAVARLDRYARHSTQS